LRVAGLLAKHLEELAHLRHVAIEQDQRRPRGLGEQLGVLQP
jgi:hypothetical protein